VFGTPRPASGLKHESSEPELFVEILGRLDWACLVCLVGTGQEINRGEGGLPLWGAALAKEAKRGHAWKVVGAEDTLLGDAPVRIQVDRSLRLNNNVRAYRNPLYIQWIDALLSGDIQRAAQIASEMREAARRAGETPLPPAVLTRSLKVSRQWLRLRCRGGRRVGLLVSSSAAPRLVPEGIQLPPRSKNLPQIARWFLDAPPKPSSDLLEIPMSEFGCQGLELDYVGLTWGGDFLWDSTQSVWKYRKLRVLQWIHIKSEADKRFRTNSYRVLLTRARAGVCIFVPKQSREEATRTKTDFDGTARILIQAGCEEITPSSLRKDTHVR
jgi:Schlafen group 3, DNA/RNA helicase domain